MKDQEFKDALQKLLDESNAKLVDPYPNYDGQHVADKTKDLIHWSSVALCTEKLLELLNSRK